MATTDRGAQGTAADRIWTVPNALSVLRLLGVPLFLWLLLGPHADGWALVLAVSGFTDWADGVAGPQAEPDERVRRDARPAGRPALHPGHARRVWCCGTSSRGGWPC